MFPYPSCIPAFFGISLIVYFFLIRPKLGFYAIKERKLTKKERKAHNEEIWNRSKKETLKIFGKWLLCKTYTEEQKKGRFFKLFVIFNYFYLGLNAIYLILCLLAIVAEPLRLFCGILADLKNNLIDFPILLLIIILASTRKCKRSRYYSNPINYCTYPHARNHPIQSDM